MHQRQARRRLVRLMAAGLVDSLCLSVAWTVLVLQVNEEYGLGAAGICSAAMLVGVAASAPVAGWMARRLDGRLLLRTAAGIEALLRVGVFVLLFSGAPVWLLALCVAAMNVTAWTGYAGMRAEVSAVSVGAVALTWYGTIVAAVEAAGVAVAALLPVTGDAAEAVLTGVVAAYVLALVPTAVVAGGSPVTRADPSAVAASRGRMRRPSVSGPMLAGVVLMALASAPTLLAVALAAQLHGREAVGMAAVAFTLGSLAAPALASAVDRRVGNTTVAWAACAVGMVAGWVAAPAHVGFLCVAQLLSGLCMTTLEGLLDSTAARRHPGQVTGALARVTAGRALGSAAGTALLPLAVVGVGLATSVVVLTTVLVVGAVCARLVQSARGSEAVASGPIAVLAGDPAGR
jgi:hypothetical protein